MLKGFVSGEEKDIVRIPMKGAPYGYQEGWEVRDNQDRLIWGREDELQTATGTLPFKGYSLPLKPKSLLGNAVQNGTPAPDNIVMPEMCGVRTGNLFDKSNTHIYEAFINEGGQWITLDDSRSIRIPCAANTQYTLSVSDALQVFRIYTSNEIDPQPSSETNQLSVVTRNSWIDEYTFTTSNDAKWIIFQGSKSVVSQWFASLMLNLGSTALPYEPYGWKIPFENHGENLFDYSALANDYTLNATTGLPYTFPKRIATLTPIDVSALSSVTLSYQSEITNTMFIYAVFNGSTLISRVASNRSGDTIDVSGGDNLYISFYSQPDNISIDKLSDIMLTPGSTAKPYSPYLNETIPVYLGEAPTVRRVRKLVLTGTTADGNSNITAAGIIYITPTATLKTVGAAYCTHFKYVNQGRGANMPSNSFTTSGGAGTSLWFKTDYTTVADFKSYLASEYAAGHPVTVWYVLTNEQTGISNEPLAKIATYADELTTVQVHGLSAPLYGIGDYKDVLNLSTGVVTRKVEKLVLTGSEGWIQDTVDDNRTVCYLSLTGVAGNYGYCSHIEWKSSYQTTEYDRVVWNDAGGGRLYISLSNGYLSSQTVNAFKAYLTAQYQAGTPVTAWYVSNTSETETVTVPTGMTGEIEGYLTQVSTPTPTNRSVPKWNGVEETGGTYAVTVYTPPEIPTTTGENALTVETSLAPSKLEVSIHAKKIHYGFKIDKLNDNSESAVIYTHDAVTMTPAHMDFTNDRFDYGSWGNAFFVRDCYPVALNLDGTIAYRLDPNDYTKKMDGTPSDIFYELLATEPSDWSTQWKQYYTKSGDEYELNSQSSAPTFATDTYYKLTYSSSFTGNFMMAFPKVWFYRHEDSQYNYIEISNHKLSNDWKCYAHINANGQEVDFIYLPLFKGVIKDSKLRSLPGQIPQGNTTATTEVNAATALGSRWQIWDHSSAECLNDLLTLMSKSIDSQGRFGQGRSTGYDSTDTVTYGKLQTGTLIKKGKFHGYSATTKEVKVFGIEGFWANRFDRLQGMLLVDNVWKIKMTPPYNFTGTDFVTLSNAEVPSVNGYLSKVQTSEYGSIPASIANGSSTRYFKDYFYKTETSTRVAVRGGTCSSGAACGFRYVHVNRAASFSSWALGASPVYK